VTVRFLAPRRRASALLVLGALVAGGVSGCAGQPGAAAVVDGREISVAELQTATSELTPYLQSATQSSVLMVLVAVPVFDKAASAAGVGVSDDDAKALLDNAAKTAADSGKAPAPTAGFSDAAVQVAKFTLLQQNIQKLPNAADVSAQITDDLVALNPEINPRYGTADFTTGNVTPATYPWLVVPAAG